MDDEIRRAKELALARHQHFVIRGQDGSLDYHTEKMRKNKKDEDKISFVVKALGMVLKCLGG